METDEEAASRAGNVSPSSQGCNLVLKCVPIRNILCGSWGRRKSSWKTHKLLKEKKGGGRGKGGEQRMKERGGYRQTDRAIQHPQRIGETSPKSPSNF